MESKLLFFKNGNNINVKISHEKIKKGYTYYRGMGKKIRLNKDDDKNEYSLIVSFDILHRFLEVNKVSSDDFKIDSKSIDNFYGYCSGNYSFYALKLTQKWVDNWWGYDCPELYLYHINKERVANSFGFNLVYFTNTLVNWGFSGTYIDEDITEKEATALTEGHNETNISNEIWKVIEAQKLTNTELEYLEEQVSQYENRIQNVIDKHKDEIIKRTKDCPQGLFAHFNIHTQNKHYNDLNGLLRNKKQDKTPYLNIKFPICSMNLILMEEQFKLIRRYIEEELGEKLYSSVIYD